MTQLDLFDIMSEDNTTAVKILSLFDGMSCGHIAFTELGITAERYEAFEIDKYATQTASHNFPDIKQNGDVFKADFTKYKGFDYLIGGSPCTYWSIAQKNNRETEASGLGWELFSQYVRALKEAEPRFFIYENNKSMSKEIRRSITETFGFEPYEINSALVSAQNRQRLYWVGRRTDNGKYERVTVFAPKDRGIMLRDIIENGFTEKAYPVLATYEKKIPEDFFRKHQSNFAAERIPDYNKDKSRPLVSNYPRNAGTGEGSLEGRAFSPNPNKQQVNLIAEPINYLNGEKAHTLIASEQKRRIADCMPTAEFKSTAVAERVEAMPKPNGELSTAQSFRVYSEDGKATTLNSGGGGAGGKTGLYAIRIENGVEKRYTVYEVKDGKITIKGKQYPIKLKDGFYIIRKLSVLECMRLQTVPEWYEFPTSNSQAYKMLGNGWTIEVIKHLINATKGIHEI